MPRMREKFMGINFVSCDTLHAHIKRAFDTWEMNHKFISFEDVTWQCQRLGEAAQSCSLAEIAILNQINNPPIMKAYSRAPQQPYSALAPALSLRTSLETDKFRFTNGKPAPVRMIGDKSTNKVSSTVGGIIGVNTHSSCWYVDSKFCDMFHQVVCPRGSMPPPEYTMCCNWDASRVFHSHS